MPLFTHRKLENYTYQLKRDNKSYSQNILKNWRPITFLNTDYKILAKIIASRITSYLDKFIHKNQTGFMKNCNISHNIRKIVNVM